MNDVALKAGTREIVVDEVFPHRPELIWKAITSGDLIGRWLLAPNGFEAVVGNRFTYQTTAAGAWDGVIHCEVLEVVPMERFVYAWKGGHERNVGYGSALDTVVSFTLAKVADGTRVRCVHSGFELPKNESAYTNMSQGWPKVVRRMGELAAEADATEEL